MMIRTEVELLFTICVLVLHDVDIGVYRRYLALSQKSPKCLACIQDATLNICHLLGQEKQVRNSAQKVGRIREVTEMGQ